MNCLEVISVLAALLAVGRAAPTAIPGCDEVSVNTTMVDCMLAQGISVEDVMRFIPSSGGSINITEEDFRNQCRHQQQYLNAGICMEDQINKCFPDGVSYNLDLEKSTQMMAEMCNDTRLNYTCLVQITRQTVEMQNCVLSKVDFQGKGMQEIVCESSIAGIQCAVDLIRKCDDYTATAFEKLESFALPQGCEGYIVVG